MSGWDGRGWATARMGAIQIMQVDERDNNWEDSGPRFRVYLHGSGATTQDRTDTYDITGADVLQVIDWAQCQAGDSLTYAVALVCDDKAHEQLNPGCARGLVWLFGLDGNTNRGLPRRQRRWTGCWCVEVTLGVSGGRPNARRRAPPHNDGTERR